MTAVFISYSRRDQAFVKRLHDALAAREYEVWVDWEDIPGAAPWRQEIRDGVGQADGFLFVISPDSAGSDVCRQELDHAVAEGKRIVPVLYREADGTSVPDAAAELNWIYLRDSDDFDTGFAALVSALDTDLDHVRTHTRTGVQAARWEASGRDSSRLLRGAELRAAEAWLVSAAGIQPEATQLQREYLLAGRQAASRRQRTVIAAVTFALVVAVVLAIVALIQKNKAQHEANVAKARQYDVESQQQLPIDPELSVLLAVQAAKLVPSPATEAALRQALAANHVRVRYQLFAGGEPPRAGDGLWSPDGTRLLVTSPNDRWSRLYRPGSDRRILTLANGAAPAGAGQSAWDARGDRIVIGGGRPVVYDAASGAIVTRLSGTALYSAFTADGTRVVTVDIHSVGHVFDLPSGRQLALFRPHLAGGATCFAVSPDGTIAAQCDTATLSNANTRAALDTWDTRSGRPLHSISSSALIGSVAFSPDSRWFLYTVSIPSRSLTTAAEQAAAAAPGTLVYDAHTGRQVMTFPGAASTAAFNPGAPQIAYASVTDGEVHLYNYVTRNSLALLGATDVIKTITFDPSGAYVVAAGRDNTARVYFSVLGGSPVETLAGHVDRIVQASFGDGDRWIATASDDGTVRVWTGPIPVASRTLVAQPVYADSNAQTLGFTADSRRIFEVSASGTGRILDAADLSPLGRLQAPPGQGFAGAAASLDGRLIATLTGPVKGPISHQFRFLGLSTGQTFDGTTGRALATITGSGQLSTGGLDRAGDRLVTLAVNGSSDLWNPRTGQLVAHLPGSTPAAAAAFSTDSAQLAIAHYPALPAATPGDTTIDLYDARTGRLSRQIQGDPLQPQTGGATDFAPLSLAFSPDGRLLAAGGADPYVEIYDAATGRGVGTLSLGGASIGSFAGSLAFSPDGSWFAVASATGVSLWRPHSAFRFARLIHHVAAGSFSSDVGGGAGVLVGFTTDSRWMLTTGDLTVEAWDPATGMELFHAYPVTRGSLSPDGREVVTVSGGGVAVYPCELCAGLNQLLALAARETTRQLTPGERLTYLNQG